MSIIKKNNWIFPDFGNDFFDRDLFDWSSRNFSLTNTTLPAINIKETEDAFMVEMAAPGMKKEDFKIELEHHLLTISSEKKEENNQQEKGKYSRKEFSYQSFTRSFSLPDTADDDKIEAKYENGVLHLVIPKKEEAKPKPAKTIQIA